MRSEHAVDVSLTRDTRTPVLHAALVLAGYSCLFGWFYARPLLDGTFLAESDLYEYYLPIFLSPITTWSHFEFGGLPAFADPGDFTAYPPHFLFARIVGSWTALTVSAFVLAACFTYAYVYVVTRSRTAAAFAGLAYGLSEAMMERLPHSGTLHAAAWLPLIVLAIEQLRGAHRRRWIAIGAMAVACCFLAGHPQPAIYVYYCGALYALIAGRVARENRQYYVRVLGMFVLGGLLVQIKALPFVEASLYMARSDVNYGQFTSHANSPAQMLSFFFPTILHEGREAPTYVGLLTAALALVGATRSRRATWRVTFWIAVAIFAWLMGMGDSTPLARIAYYVPLYANFRASARHLFLAAFALCTLAGIGIAALERREVSRRTLRTVVAVLIASVAIGATVLATVPAAFQFEVRRSLPWSLPVWSDGIWVQFGFAAAAAVVTLSALRFGRAKAWIALALTLLVADTLYSLPYAAGASGLRPITIPAAATRPSIHARELAASVSPLHQRLLAPGGTHRDAVVPAAWARLWQIPIAGGYGPMLLANQNTLAQMGTNGAVRLATLAPDDASLDLLAVRTIIMKGEDLAEPATFERDGLTWSKPPLDINVGRADCGHAYPRMVSLALPPQMDISEIALVGHLRCAEHIATGIEVMRLRLEGTSGTVHEQLLRAGVDIAERELADPSVAARANHKPAQIFDDPDARPFEYLIRVRPPTPVRAQRLVIDVPAMTGWVAIDRMSIVDNARKSRPLSMPGLYLDDTSRWVETNRFHTSRTSDRAQDERTSDETEFVVFENRHAMPRAWMVSDVIPASTPDLREAIRHSQLPDGSRFDPHATALVDSEEVPERRRFSPGAASVAVDSIQDGHISLDVTSGGGFVVLSEAFYPGWRARIGSTSMRVERVNLGLQGVEVPPGTHRVDFEFRSPTLRAGFALSTAGLFLSLLLLVRSDRRASTAAVVGQ